MQIDTAERHLELRKSVQPRFFGTPIKGAAPILHELPEVTDIGTVGPRVPWGLVRETGAGEPVAEIGRCLVANSQRERFRSRGHASLVSPVDSLARTAKGGLIRHCRLANLRLLEGRHHFGG